MNFLLVSRTGQLFYMHNSVQESASREPFKVGRPERSPVPNQLLRLPVYQELIKCIRDRSKLLLFFVHEPQANKGRRVTESQLCLS
jgi:hypothetical protein